MRASPLLRARLLSLLATLALAACNGGGDDTPVVQVPELSPGTYLVNAGTTEAPMLGRYFSGSDGSRLLVLHNSAEQAERLYRRSAADAAWTAVPAATADVSIALQSSFKLAQASAAPTLAGLAGRYVAQLAPGIWAQFSIAADGSLSAGSASPCKLSGRLDAKAGAGGLAVSLNASGCGSSVPASSQGFVLLDAEEQPARFRLLADDGRSLLDLRAFAE